MYEYLSNSINLHFKLMLKQKSICTDTSILVMVNVHTSIYIATNLNEYAPRSMENLILVEVRV